MRSATIGADGVFRDSEGLPMNRRRPPAPPPARVPILRNPPPKRAFRSPYATMSDALPVPTQLPPNCPAPQGGIAIGPARCVANQVGVPTSKFSFSKTIGDPDTQIYPSRIVYQATDDLVSVYAVSARIADNDGGVKLFKIEGVGSGRWYEILLVRSVDPDGTVHPGLMTDFMVVPDKMNTMIWRYVGDVPPIFEGSDVGEYSRVSPSAISAAFQIAREGFGLIPSDESAITKDNVLSDVVLNGAAALSSTVYALDIMGAGYDVSRLGRHAYNWYSKVGYELLTASKDIVYTGFDIVKDPSTLSDNASKIVAIQTEIMNKEDLHGAYLLRSELYTVWDAAINLGIVQDINLSAKYTFKALLQYTGEQRSQILANGVSEDALNTVNNFASLFVDEYQANDNAIWDGAYDYFSSDAVQPSDVYDVIYGTPLVLNENAQFIRDERKKLKEGPPSKSSLSFSAIYLSGLGAGEVTRSIEAVKKAIGGWEVDPKNRERAGIEALQALKQKAIDTMRTSVNNVILERSQEVATYLKDAAVARGTYEIIKQAKSIDAQVDILKDQIATLRKQLSRETDPDKQKNLESDIKNKESTQKGLEKDAQNVRKNISKPTEQFLDIVGRTLEPRWRLGPNPTSDEQMAAELEVFTRISRDEGFIKTFLTKGTQESLAMAFYQMRGAGIPVGASFDLIKTGAGNLDVTPTQLYTNAEGGIAAIAKELGYENNSSLVEGLVLSTLKAGGSIDLITKDKIETTFVDAMKNKTDASGKVVEEGLGEKAIRTRLEKVAAWVNFKQIIDLGELAYNKDTINADAARQVQYMRETNTRGIDQNLWERFRKAADAIRAWTDKAGDDKKSTLDAVVESLTAAGQPYADKVSKDVTTDFDGPALQTSIRNDAADLKKLAARVSAYLGDDYKSYKEKADQAGGLTQKEHESNIGAAQDMISMNDRLDKNIKKVLSHAREYEGFRKFRGWIWEKIKFLYSLDKGPAMTILEKSKGQSAPIQLLIAIGGVLPLLLVQTVIYLKTAALFQIPGAADVYEFLNGLIASAKSWFGGDTTQRQYAPSEKPSGGALPFLGFALAIALITSGRTVFDAVSKTVGGFFQFATAILPGAKKKGFKGGGGGGGGAKAGRRGAPIVVEDWLERLDAAKHRLDEAESKGDKRGAAIARREVEKAIDKLKKAKEEGADVPEGLWNLWGFNWLG